MRPSRIGIPLGVALGLSGLAMYLSAKPSAAPQTELDFSQPQHPVTPEMMANAAEMSRKVGPAFELNDVRGEPRSIAGTNLERPQLVLFILDTCPCSVDAQPLFNKLSKHWSGKADFVGVINTNAQKGRAWMSDYRVAFPVVPDKDLKIIKAYEAKQSVYSVLISKGGKIVKMWPGYSREMLKEINEKIGEAAGEVAKPFDAEYAPVEKTSGCYF